MKNRMTTADLRELLEASGGNLKTARAAELFEGGPQGAVEPMRYVAPVVEPLPLPAPDLTLPVGSPIPGPDAYDGRESTLVGEIIQRLGQMGVSVSEIGQRKAKGSGTTEGVADLLVRRESWPRFVGVGIEVKEASGKASSAQAKRYEAGWHGFAWSVSDAVRIVESVDRALGEGKEAK